MQNVNVLCVHSYEVLSFLMNGHDRVLVLVRSDHVFVCVQALSGRGGMQASGDVSQVPIHTVFLAEQYADHTLSTKTHMHR